MRMEEQPFDPKAPYRFEFTMGFYNEAIEDFDFTVKYFLFLIPDEATLQRVRWHDDHSDDHRLFLDDMCEYGEHSINMDNNTILDGYDSTEIEENKADEVMEKWRDFWIGEGISCGPVVTMSEAEYKEKFSSDGSTGELREPPLAGGLQGPA